MIICIYTLADYPHLIIVVVLSVITVVAVSGGVSGIPFADVTAKVVPHYRLGTYWALRNIIGGVLALCSGLLLRRILASDMPFPNNFAFIFAIGATLAGTAYLAFCAIREPEGPVAIKQPLRQMLRRIPELLQQNPSFRRYMRVRFLALLALLTDPFYAIYALQQLGAPATALGSYVIVATASSITANFLFRRPANRAQNVTILQISIVLLILAPLAAFFIHNWVWFALVFVLSAAGQSGMGIAAWNLLYAVAKEEERTLYVGTANTLLSLPSLAPILIGGVIDSIGFNPGFILAAVTASIALMFSFRFVQMRALDRQALEKARA
jgi:hypothetical protein